MSQSSNKAINILLLGETGVGKSTTLNALTNYLKFDGDYKKAFASSDELEEVIPIPFILPGHGNGPEITIGSRVFDANERRKAGLSATIAPISYMFNFELSSIRIIDTPGMGDTAGKNEDEENFLQILLHLQAHKLLNAVVFVLKNSNARMTTYFKYCITQLLVHLHKSITANIIFCFTHSRNSMFGPGEGFKTLQAFLEDESDLIKKAELKLIRGKNCFFIDNDAYRILVAKKQKYSLDEDVEFEYRSSWNKSANQMKNMLQAVISLPPHKLTETVSLNQASKIIHELAQPMIQMQTTIKENIKKIEDNKLKHLNLNDLVNTKIWDLQSKQLSRPSTVCDSCYKLEEGKVVYKTCHENCFCIFVTDDTKDQFMLRFCKAMDWSFNCQKCNCSFRKHKHISYEYEKVMRPGIDKNMLDKINKAPDEMKKIEMALNGLKTTQEELKDELETIQGISAKFGYLLSNNSMLHNKVFEDYLQSLIDEELKKEHPNVESLNRLKMDLEDRVRNLTTSIIQNATIPVHLEDIPAFKHQLLNLKHNGKSFKQILETNQRIKEEKFNYQEKNIPFIIKKGKTMFGNLFWHGS